MEEVREDHAYAAFMAAASRLAPDLPRELFERAYGIERRHQYEHGSQRTSFQELNLLVEEFAENLARQR